MGQSRVLNSRYKLSIIILVAAIVISASSYAFLEASATHPASTAELCTATGHYYDILPVAGDAVAPHTWKEAHADALLLTHDGMTGHLATITSTAEHKCIVEHTRGGAGFIRAYIGAIGNAVEGQDASTVTYSWITGEGTFTASAPPYAPDGSIAPFTTSTWDVGEPNNINFDGAGPIENFENYVEMLDASIAEDLGKLNDIANNNGFTSYYVVEFDNLPASIPTAIDDAVSTDEDTILEMGTAIPVLDNDTDVDGDIPLAVDSFTKILPFLGILNQNGDKFEYDPDDMFESLGTGDVAFESFSYVVIDPSGLTDVGKATVTVDGVNDDPTADSQTGGNAINLNEGATADFSLTGADIDSDSVDFLLTVVGLDGSVGDRVPPVDPDDFEVFLPYTPVDDDYNNLTISNSLTIHCYRA